MQHEAAPARTDTAHMDAPGACQGLWRRLLIARPDAPVNAHDFAAWLQGPGGLFGDLRQGVGVQARVQASCLAELSPGEARALAGQGGFAGRFMLDGDTAEWVRMLDFQPPGARRDRGRLGREGDLLIERGIEDSYVEYWQRPPEPDTAPCAGARFSSMEDGRAVFLVQWGRHFLYARDRAMALPPGGTLADLVRDADSETARALVDCEISLGAITAEGWCIARSTLPWRVGALLLGPGVRWCGEGALRVMDMEARGLPTPRTLETQEVAGVFAPKPHVAAPIAAPTASVHRLKAAAPFRSVPVVDISALGGGDPAAEQAAVVQLRDAASEVGFLHVSGHGIAPALIARLRAAARSFFALPHAEKMRVYIGHSDNHRGYVPEGEELFADAASKDDRKEAFDLSLDIPQAELLARCPMLGPNQWPDLPGFREDVMAYYAAVFALGRRLLHGFCMALGQRADALDHLVTTPPSQLRLIHYPFNPDARDAQGIGSHTDYEIFTMLLATSPGLEVMNAAGEWIDAPPVDGALVVNIGDMMEYWSGGAFVATSHRVRKVAEERYSFPFFFALDYDAAIRPPGAGETAPGIVCGDHLYARTIQTFRYLKDRAQRGDIAMPQEACPLSSFGREARTSKRAPG